VVALVLIRMGTVAALAHHFGVDPATTAVGRASRRFEHSLLR
jgi:hypothetical protein